MYGPHMMWKEWWGLGPFGMGWLFMLLFWILVIIGLVYLVKMIFGKTRPWQSDDAIDILNRRYAAGEIDREEYERIKKSIEG